MPECILNTAATDALVIKHQVISTHSAEWICIIILDQFYTEMLYIHKNKFRK